MKKMYFVLTDNEDMNVTVHDLETCKEIVETRIQDIPEEDIEEFQFVILR